MSALLRVVLILQQPGCLYTYRAVGKGKGKCLKKIFPGTYLFLFLSVVVFLDYYLRYFTIWETSPFPLPRPV